MCPPNAVFQNVHRSGRTSFPKATRNAGTRTAPATRERVARFRRLWGRSGERCARRPPVSRCIACVCVRARIMIIFIFFFRKNPKWVLRRLSAPSLCRTVRARPASQSRCGRDTPLHRRRCRRRFSRHRRRRRRRRPERDVRQRRPTRRAHRHRIPVDAVRLAGNTRTFARAPNSRSTRQPS